MEKDPNIELRSEEVKEILGRVPNWIVRSGTTLFFVVILIIIVGSWFFKYPDVINSRLIVTTENPPADLVARATGKLHMIYVKDDQQVQKEDLLAVIENPAINEDVFDLKSKLKVFQTHLTGNDVLGDEFLKQTYHLGEVQTYFNSFLKTYADYHRFLELKFHDRKIAALQSQLKQYKVYYNRQFQQKEILSKELKISQTQFQRDSMLFARGVLSKSDFQNSQKKYLQKEYSFHGSETSLSSTQINISGVEQQVIDLELQKEKNSKEYVDLLTQSYDNLMAQISIWEQRYLLKSPIEGKVSFNKFWNKNQNVKSGDQVFTVIPNDSTRLIARMELGIIGAGKVKVGQRVNIKLDNYPYMEYGMLEGKIRTISKVPENQKYSLEVDFPNGMITNYDIQLKFSHKIEGSAEIITEDYRLLERFFNPIKALLKKRI
jgi:HlyD family secretion protein